MEKSTPELDAPTEIFRTVALTRRPNAELRTREHLTSGEVDALIDAAKANRQGHRDATVILIALRHGLRAAEACDLRWDEVDFDGAVLHARRVKNGIPSTHPLQGDEMRALRRLQLDHPAFDRAAKLLAEKAKLIDSAQKDLAQLRDAGK